MRTTRGSVGWVIFQHALRFFFSYQAQKQLIARTTASLSTSCRPLLLVITAVPLLRLSSPERPGTGCGVVTRMGYYRSFRFSSRISALFFFARTSAVHRAVISEVYANVVYAMDFSCVKRRLGADVSENVSRFRGNILDYNRILRPRARRLVKPQRETGSSASMIRTDTMVFVLQQSTCLQCGAKQRREHP